MGRPGASKEEPFKGKSQKGGVPRGSQGRARRGSQGLLVAPRGSQRRSRRSSTGSQKLAGGTRGEPEGPPRAPRDSQGRARRGAQGLFLGPYKVLKGLIRPLRAFIGFSRALYGP